MEEGLQSMADTDNLALTLLEQSQAQKHVTVNEALLGLDAVVALSVIDKDLTVPPGSPSAGDRYIVGASATGDWAGEDNNVAAYQDSAWLFYTPQEGWLSWVEDEEVQYRWTGSAWAQREIAEAPFGSAMKARVIEEELTLTGASVTSTVAFPNQCIILGVSARVTTTITGPASGYQVGDGSTVDRFGSLPSGSMAAGSTNQGTIGPAGNYGSTTVTVTANGVDFTAGVIRVALMYLELQPPTS